MAIADYFEGDTMNPPSKETLKKVFTTIPHKIMYGSDFPNIR